jgi:hypothetical protein
LELLFCRGLEKGRCLTALGIVVVAITLDIAVLLGAALNYEMERQDEVWNFGN